MQLPQRVLVGAAVLALLAVPALPAVCALSDALRRAVPGLRADEDFTSD